MQGCAICILRVPLRVLWHKLVNQLHRTQLTDEQHDDRIHVHRIEPQLPRRHPNPRSINECNKEGLNITGAAPGAKAPVGPYAIGVSAL